MPAESRLETSEVLPRQEFGSTESIFDALPAFVCDKTLFVVAHRLSTVQNSDRILLLNENRLVAIGTHQELLESNDFYRTLVAKQQIIME